MGRLMPRMMFATVLAATALTTHAAQPGEWTILSTYVSGDYGTDTVTDTQAMTLRYAVGSDLQLRVELPYVRTLFSYGVVNTGVGTVPLGPGGENTRRNGGGNGGGPTGPGGSGVSAAVLALVAENEYTSGIGDLRVGLSKRLVGGGVKLYRFDAGLEVKIPTADEMEGRGTGEADYRVGLAWDYRFWSATVFAGGGWNRLGDPWWGDLNDVLDLYAGIESDPIARERLRMSGWVAGHQETIDGQGNLLTAGVGLRTTGKVRWYAQIVAGLSDASPDVAAQFGLSFGFDSPGNLRWRGRQ